MLLALPAAVVLLVLYAIPLARLMGSSFVGPSGLSFGAYVRILGDAYGRSLVWNSVRLGGLTTVIALAVGYPAAFGLAFAQGALRSVFLASLLLPLAASVIVKSFAWSTLMRSHGVVNEALMSSPSDQRSNPPALHSGLADLRVRKHLPALHDFADLLGCRPDGSDADRSGCNARGVASAAFLRVVLPLSLPGMVAGVSLVFSLSVSAYVVPTLLMGESYPTLATTIARAFLLLRDPALGSAAGAILMAIGLAVVVASRRFGERSAGR